MFSESQFEQYLAKYISKPERSFSINLPENVYIYGYSCQHLAYGARFSERALLDTACNPAKARAQLSEMYQYNSASPRPRSSWRFDALFDIALFEAKEVSCIYR